LVNRIIIPILLLISNFGCNEPTQVNLTQKSDFPSSVGNEWTYATYDSIAHTLGTMEVQILNDISNSDTQSTELWQFKSETDTDTVVVVIRKDTVLFLNYDLYPERNYPVLNLIPKLVFPLEVGNTWTINGGSRADKVLVDSLGNISVPAGKFTNAFQIKEEWRSLNASGSSVVWFVPKLGIVWLQIKAGNMVTLNTNTVWKLKAYNIK